MKHNFREGSCPHSIQEALKDEPHDLKSLYGILDKFSHSSIRRSLYELRDAHIIQRTKNGNKWTSII